MTWRRTLMSLLLVAAFVLSACAAPAAAPTAPQAEPPSGEAAVAGEPVRGGVVIVGTPQEPGVLNPLLASSSIEDAISSFTVEGLVQVDNEGNYVPVLAEALPEVSDDGLVATYKLKPDITFSNGDPFTCADVQFTLEAILSDLSGASTAGYNRIDEIECVDDLTAVVYFSRVYAPYLRLFSYIIPRGSGDLATLDSWEFNRNPIGAGPWIVKEWVAGDYIEFAPNPYYREEGKPYLDSMIVNILPSREVGMQLLGTGEITALWDITEADFPTLDSMADRGVTFAGAQTGENELLLFNFADPAVDAPANAAANPHPVLFDLSVREAIELAIDKQEIVETLLYGNVNVGTTVLPNGTFACPQPPTEFSVEKANALLDEAGWVMGTDGVRTKDGVKAELKITTTSGNLLRE
ncbi:MAG: peptide ABC transporter substrate-binding protein, partial [Caldilinea sp.]